tara:strand:- start:326 stop:733 length:408 start_codon:yes stop_codon:yes gene_type:complete
MKKDSIPQDESSLSSKDMKEMCYAVDENGEYSTALSTGWKPKTIALEVTMNDLNERIENAKKSVLEGKKSPIVYFMERSRMDWSILASYMGKRKWIVKRNAKPKVFKKLKDTVINKYAEVFEIEVNELKNFNENS